MKTTRRQVLGILGSAAALPAAADIRRSVSGLTADSGAECRLMLPGWGIGSEGQRIADLGDGRFLNPILSGDHPDPTILKDADDYYMTFTSLAVYPGLAIWHSRCKQAFNFDQDMKC